MKWADAEYLCIQVNVKTIFLNFLQLSNVFHM